MQGKDHNNFKKIINHTKTSQEAFIHMKKATEGTRSQIKKATSVKDIKRLYNTARRKEENGEYDFARPGYIDRLKGLADRHIAKLVEIEVKQLNMKTRSEK